MRFNSTIDEYLGYLFISTAILVYCYLFVNYSVNMPVDDDYGAILQMLDAFSSTSSWGDKLSILFQQHNAHIVLIYRLLFVIQYLLVGEINFLVPVYIGNILWLLTIFLLFQKIGASNKLHNAVAVLVVLNSQYYIATIWSALFFFTIFFAVLSFILIESKSNRALFGSLLCSMFAVFNSGNGILVPVLLVFYFVAKKEYSLRFIITLIFSLSIYIVYFSIFSVSGIEKNEAFSLTMFSKMAVYIYVFITSHFFGITENPTISKAILLSIMGFATYLVSAVIIFKKKYYKTKPVVILVLLFVIGTAFVTAYGRIGFGMFQGATHRYRMFPSLLSAVLILVFLMGNKIKPAIQKYIVWGLVCVFFMLFALSVYKYFPYAQKFKDTSITGAFLVNKTITQKEVPFLNDNPRPAQILQKSMDNGIFSIPAFNENEVDVWQENQEKLSLNIESGDDLRSKVRLSCIAMNYAYVSVKKDITYPYELFLGLRNENDTIYFPLKPQSVKHHYNNQDCYGILLNLDNYIGLYDEIMLFEQHYKTSRKLNIGSL